MPDTGYTFKQLYHRFLTGTLTDGERALFWAMAVNENRHTEIVEVLEQQADQTPAIYAHHLPEAARERILSVIVNDEIKNLPRSVHRVHLLRTAWFRVAAAILLFTIIGAYFWFKPTTNIADATSIISLRENDIRPGSDRAVLTLSNGKKVILAGPASAIITDQSLSIQNKNGQLVYTGGDLVVTNTMTTPKGGQYRLVLSDGTKVWLNAASSITYPTAFKENNREVTITGEAYFEVAKNKEKPFVVKTDSDEIIVLGTSFNINAYDDEEAVKTSLIEGSINVNDAHVNPGQAYQNGKLMKANIEQDLAWKNGKFNFHKVSLAVALRQIARWYDVELVFKKMPTTILWGTMSRNLTLNQVLKLLGETGVQYELKGKILEIK